MKIDIETKKELEKLRKSCAFYMGIKYFLLGLATVLLALAVILIIIINYVAHSDNTDLFVAIIIAAMLGGLALIFIFVLFNNLCAMPRLCDYKKKYKALVVNSALEELFKNFEYESEIGMGKHAVEEAQLSNIGNVFTSNDYIRAKRNGYIFQHSDICIQDVSRYRSRTYFNGKWVIFEFKRNFVQNLQIREKGYSYKTFPTFLNRSFSQHRQKESAPIKSETGSSEFDKQFDVYIKSAEDSRSIINSQFISSLLEFRKRLNCALFLSFTENRLHIALYSKKDEFEPKIFKENDLEAESGSALRSIGAYLDFVEEITLDEGIFA